MKAIEIFDVALVSIPLFICVLYFIFRSTKKTYTKLSDTKDLHYIDGHGSSKFAEIEDVEGRENNPLASVQFGQMTERTMVIIPPGKGDTPYNVGGNLGPFMFSHPESNVLICAPTRAGKTAGSTIPTALQYEGSLFCIDPDAEITAVTLPYRQHDLKQMVRVIDPWNVYCTEPGMKSFRFNPMDYLDPEDPDIETKAEEIADLCMVRMSGEKDSDFWDKGGKQVFTAFLLFVALESPGPRRNLLQVRDLLYLPPKLRDQLLEDMLEMEEFDGAIKRGAAALLTASDRASGDIMATIQVATSFLSDRAVAKALEESDFDLASLKEIPTTVYIIVPSRIIKQQSSFLRLLVGLTATKIKSDQIFSQRTMFMVEEAASLGKMEEFLNVANSIKFGINYTFSFQSLAQIEMLYGQHGAKIIQDNCHYKYFLKPETYETAKLISEYLGKETVLQENKSEGTSTQGSSSGTSQSHIARPLKFPEEILQGDPTTGYLIKAGQYPTLIKNRPYYLDDFLRDRAAPNPFHPESEVA